MFWLPNFFSQDGFLRSMLGVQLPTAEDSLQFCCLLSFCVNVQWLTVAILLLYYIQVENWDG
jgi:hypothetical protein